MIVKIVIFSLAVVFAPAMLALAYIFIIGTISFILSIFKIYPPHYKYTNFHKLNSYMQNYFMNTDMPTTIKEWGILYLRLTIVGLCLIPIITIKEILNMPFFTSGNIPIIIPFLTVVYYYIFDYIYGPIMAIGNKHYIDEKTMQDKIQTKTDNFV